MMHRKRTCSSRDRTLARTRVFNEFFNYSFTVVPESMSRFRRASDDDVCGFLVRVD